MVTQRVIFKKDRMIVAERQRRATPESAPPKNQQVNGVGSGDLFDSVIILSGFSFRVRFILGKLRPVTSGARLPATFLSLFSDFFLNRSLIPGSGGKAYHRSLKAERRPPMACRLHCSRHDSGGRCALAICSAGIVK
jgi:hypothetical protein